jgi:hypothetical protein
LSGGASSCSSPGDDFYYALFKAWEPSENENEQLRSWLDPGGTQSPVHDGLDPYAANPCYRLSNIYDAKLQDSIEIKKLPAPATGSLFGVNSFRSSEYAEEYLAAGAAQIDGVYLVTPSVTDAVDELNVEITVYGSSAGKPQNLLHTERFYPVYTELSLIDSTFIETRKRLGRAQESFVRFSKPVPVKGTFFVGYRIVASPAGSAFAIYNVRAGQTTRNTAWVHNQDEWIRASQHPLQAFNTSLFLDPVLHYENGSSNDTLDKEVPVRLFPDEGHSRIHVVFSGSVEKADFRLFGVNGQLLMQETISGREAIVPVPGFRPGIYLVNIRSSNIFYTQKMVF